MNAEKLDLAIDLFEAKINKLEDIYKNEHKDNVDNSKMKKYVNRKLKREMAFLTAYNITPCVEILKNTEKFKY